MDKVPTGHGTETPYRYLGRKRRTGRTQYMNLSVKPETKVELRKWAQELFMDSASDLIEYLANKHREGLIIITGEADFFAAMARSIEMRCVAASKEAAEEQTLATLADRGLVDGPWRK